MCLILATLHKVAYGADICGDWTRSALPSGSMMSDDTKLNPEMRSMDL